MSSDGLPAQMRTVVFSLAESEPRRLYDELFERCPFALIQQSTWWAEVIAPLGPDQPVFASIVVDGRAVAGLPLYLYPGSMGPVLTSVPQAGPLGGVFHEPGLDVAVASACITALLRSALELAQQHTCVALSVITDPFQTEAPEYQCELQPHYRLENFTQWTDLRAYFAPDGSVAFGDYHRRSNLSRNLAKAKSAGLTVRLSTDAGEIEALYAIHLKRHAELGASPLDYRLLQNIATILVPRKKAFVLVVESARQVASWGVYIYHHRVLDVLRLNMDSDFAVVCPNFLNTDESLRLARSLGVSHYNWQSAPTRSSGVYRYKVQWAAQESPYCFLTKLFRPPTDLAAAGLERLKQDYPLHFIAPYAAAEQGFAPGTYRKE